MIIEDRFKLRGGLAAALASLNEVPLRREMIIELDNLFTTGEFKAKIGDGTMHYNDLPYLATGGASGLSLAGINDQTGTAYTLALTDAAKDVRCTNAAAITLTVPLNSSVAFPVGTLIAFSQGDVGAVTATAASGVTISAKNGAATTGQYDARVLEYLGSDTWRVW